MKSMRFDGIYNGKEVEVGHWGGGGVSIFTHIHTNTYTHDYR